MIDRSLNKIIADALIAKKKLESELHKSSGKLSAGRLGEPLQWQMLSAIGVPRQQDDYALLKFQRGNDVEDFVVQFIPEVTETQKAVEYMGVVGFVDAVVRGIMPHEIKSVTNLKFKRIEKSKEADRSHRLQATLYALALGSTYYQIDYVASDDYRVLGFRYETEETASTVQDIITKYGEQRLKQIVPEFEAVEDWHANVKYNPYPGFMALNEQEIETKLEEEYLEQFKRLKGVL